MSNDENRRNASGILSSFEEIIRLIAEYPRLSLPAGVLLAIFWLASVFKTLIDGFEWAYKQWGFYGVLVVVTIIALLSLLSICLVSLAIAARPVIKPFPARQLSRSPTIRWDFRPAQARHISYELLVKLLPTGPVHRIDVPEGMHHAGITGIAGEMEISVHAMEAGSKIRSSRKIRTEIYRDSVERISKTGKLRVAVHTDPGEEVFCHFQNGRWRGFDIDFSRLIASELQEDPDIRRRIEVEYSFYEWPAVINAPKEHEVDMAIASISISAERVKKYGINFSVPYAESRLGVVAYGRAFPANSPENSVTLDELKGRTIAVHNETTAHALAVKAEQDARYGDIRFVVAANNDELRELLRDSSVDAALYDYQRAFTLLEAGAILRALDHDIDIEHDRYGIAYSRVNARLLDKVDGIIAKHRLRLETMLARFIESKRRELLPEAPGSGPAGSGRPAYSGKTNLFVYGSLMYEQVWRRLVTRKFLQKAARLSGYRRLRIKNEDYPALVKGIGTVFGNLWLDVDDENLRRLDRFEAACYQRVPGVVIDESGAEIAVEYFEIKESHRSIVEEVEWNEREFERKGLSRFVKNYAGFNQES